MITVPGIISVYGIGIQSAAAAAAAAATLSCYAAVVAAAAVLHASSIAFHRGVADSKIGCWCIEPD